MADQWSRARRQALVLCRALDAAERAVAAGETRTETLLELVRQEIGNHSRGPTETPMSVRALDLARLGGSCWRRLARDRTDWQETAT